MNDELRDTILEAMEKGLEAQLRAVRRLRRGEESREEPRPRTSMSQVDMAYDILLRAAHPLHVNEILSRIHAVFGITVDRESLVSSLTKKVAREDRFVRADKNTFGLKGGKR